MKTRRDSLLKENSLKITRSRQLILEIFLNSKKPLSVKEIKAKLKNVDEVTIYRNIEQLLDSNIITRIDISHDRAYFELVHDHHHHIVCTICGTIEDVHNCVIPTEKMILKKAKNFSKISSHSLEFFGICKACHNK